MSFGSGTKVGLKRCSNLSQEQLADRVQISTTHMSHIETGNTKLSLAVLVKIAEVLSVQTDALIYDAPQVNRTTMTDEIGIHVTLDN